MDTFTISGTMIRWLQDGEYAEAAVLNRPIQDLKQLLRRFDVKDYGAQGNGQSDDSSYIQAAINDAIQSGGVVFFPAGTYLIQSTLSIDNSSKGIILEGVPGTKIINNFTGRHLSVFNSSKVAILNLSFDSAISGQNFGGIEISQCNRIVLKDITVNNSSWESVLISQSDTIVLSNIESNSAGTSHFYVSSSWNVLVNSLRADTSTYGGVVLDGTENVVFNGCSIKNSSGASYYFTSAENVLLFSCESVSPVYEALSLNNGSIVEVNGFNSKTPGTDHLFVDSTSKITAINFFEDGNIRNFTNLDFEFLNSSVGPILVDVDTGDRYRIIVSKGKLRLLPI